MHLWEWGVLSIRAHGMWTHAWIHVLHDLQVLRERVRAAAAVRGHVDDVVDEGEFAVVDV